MKKLKHYFWKCFLTGGAFLISSYMFASPLNNISKKQTKRDVNEEVEKTSDYRLSRYSDVNEQAGLQQASLKVDGVIKDATTGETLIGVNIQEVNTNNISVTDVNGWYSLYNIKNKKSVLRFTYVGYKTVDIIVGNQKKINVNLQPDVQGLDEVVVVGYGSQKKASVIGAISTIQPGTLQVAQTRGLSNALAGQMAGVIAVQRSGEPGFDSADFWIRGINTFGAAKNPLVLIDGIERNLDDIAPEEIESFSILKDASATAVYGVRGANGVIVIETKKGQIGKPRITVKADVGFSMPTKLPEFLGGVDYMLVTNEAARLSDMRNVFTDEQIENTRLQTDPDFYPDINWMETITNKLTPNSRTSVDVNGGSERLRYSLVLSHIGEKGMYVTDDTQQYDSSLKYDRYNVRSNIDVNLTSSTILHVGIGGYISNRKFPGSSAITHIDDAFNTSPIIHPIRYSNGQIPKNMSAGVNPWAQVTQSGYSKRYDALIQSTISLQQDLEAIWSPLKGLKAKFVFSFDSKNHTKQIRTRTIPHYWATGRDDDGNLITNILNEGNDFLGYSKEAGGNRTMYLEGRLNYNRRFGDHNVSGLFMFNRREYIDGSADSGIKSLPYRNQGIAGRLGYNFRDTYFIEGNFGYNGSENFKKGFRYGFFPSMAVGWMITNEPFMEGKTNVLSKLKIRGSVGQVGNDKLDGRRFPYISTIASSSGYQFGWLNDYKRSGYQEGEWGVDDLTWETATKIDVGTEIGLFNLIEIQADFFKERRKDIFMRRKTIPETAGFNNMPYANFGKVDNIGVELNLEMNHRFNKDLNVSFRSNFTYAKNTVIEYDEPESLKNTSRSQTGQSLNQPYGLIATGLFTPDDFSDLENYTLKEGIPEQFGIVKPGDIKYKDVDGDGVITELDRSPIGNPTIPEIVYGFGTSIKYKNVDLNIFFQGSAKVSTVIGGKKFAPGSGGGASGNIYDNADDRWREEDPYNQDVFWPRLANYENENNSKESTWWQKNTSFLRLKNLEIGYTLPKKWQRACAMRNARIFMRGTNLLTFSPFKMWDPEVDAKNGLKYPIQRVCSMGVQVTF